MNAKLKKGIDLLKGTFKEWSEDEAGNRAAALAYFTAVSIAPLVVLLLAVVALIWGEEAASGQLKRYLAEVFGSGLGTGEAKAGGAAAFIEEIIANAKTPTIGSWAGALSLLVLFWGSTKVFAQLQSALNHIWDAPQPDKVKLTKKVKKRLLSLAMVLTLGFLLIVSLVLSSVLSGLGDRILPDDPAANFLLRAMNVIVSFLVIAVLIGAIYKLLPDVRISWRHVAIGALVTAFLFTLGKAGLAWYLGRASGSSPYGAAGSVVAFLIWVFYTSQIFFFGAELTQVYARRFSRDRRSVGKTNELEDEEDPSLVRLAKNERDGTSHGPTFHPIRHRPPAGTRASLINWSKLAGALGISLILNAISKRRSERRDADHLR